MSLRRNGFPQWLLRIAARILVRRLHRLLLKLDPPPPPAAPAGGNADALASGFGGAPAHWVEKVRRGAPHLLRPMGMSALPTVHAVPAAAPRRLAPPAPPERPAAPKPAQQRASESRLQFKPPGAGNPTTPETVILPPGGRRLPVRAVRLLRPGEPPSVLEAHACAAQPPSPRVLTPAGYRLGPLGHPGQSSAEAPTAEKPPEGEAMSPPVASGRAAPRRGARRPQASLPPERRMEHLTEQAQPGLRPAAELAVARASTRSQDERAAEFPNHAPPDSKPSTGTPSLAAAPTAGAGRSSPVWGAVPREATVRRPPDDGRSFRQPVLAAAAGSAQPIAPAARASGWKDYWPILPSVPEADSKEALLAFSKERQRQRRLEREQEGSYGSRGISH